LGKLGGLLDRSWLAVSIIVIIVEDDDTFTRPRNLLPPNA
jgi:hypothetical protein